MILIDTLYVNKGGGAVLLKYLIETILQHPHKDDFYFLLDPRFEKPAALAGNCTTIPNKIIDRLKFYKQNKKKFSKVFCFANTPPPVKMGVPCYTYFHNQKLLESSSRWYQRDYRKLFLKYLVVKLYNSNTDTYIVQTKHMAEEMIRLKLKDAAHCSIIPFYESNKFGTASLKFEDRPKDHFVFVSTPSFHKNHNKLLDAWEYLFSKGHTPVLHVTIDDTAPHLLLKAGEMRAKGIQIINHNYVVPKELYFNAPYLIYPSLTESFGLPLIEAVECGMKVLAPDLPYVADVIKPSLVFDPFDIVSIADAVITALSSSLPDSKVVAQNEIDKLLDLLADIS